MESVCGSLQKGKGRIPMKIGFVGLGNMATAIIGGLLREGTTFSGEDGDATVITAANIIGSAKTEATRQKRAEQFGIAVTASNREVAEAADVLVLAVKPQFFPEVIAEIREVVNENTLVISIAAGLTLERIAALSIAMLPPCGSSAAWPNTPALVNAGAPPSCLGRGRRRPTKPSAYDSWKVSAGPSSFPSA